MIRVVSSNPQVPLPDPLWYEFLREIAPDLPDCTVDIVEYTMKSEQLGLTLVDLILYNHGISPVRQYAKSRHPISEGLALLLSHADLGRLTELSVPCVVQCYEEGHPRDWVQRYPNRLWVTRFWFGGPVWLSYLGVEHVVCDVHYLVNPAWLAPLSRAVSWGTSLPMKEAHDRFIEQVPDILFQIYRNMWGEEYA